MHRINTLNLISAENEESSYVALSLSFIVLLLYSFALYHSPSHTLKSFSPNRRTHICAKHRQMTDLEANC